MNVKIDDGYGWVFMRSDGKVFDSCGKEVKWVPIGDAKEPKEFKWEPVVKDDDKFGEINWVPIGDEEPIDEPMDELIDEPIYEGKGENKQSKTPSKETKNGSAK